MFAKGSKIKEVEHEHRSLKYKGKFLDHDVMASLYKMFEEAGMHRRPGFAESDRAAGMEWGTLVGKKLTIVVKIVRADFDYVKLICPNTPFDSVSHVSGTSRRKGGSTLANVKTVIAKNRLPNLLNLILEKSTIP